MPGMDCRLPTPDNPDPLGKALQPVRLRGRNLGLRGPSRARPASGEVSEARAVYPEEVTPPWLGWKERAASSAPRG